MTVSQDIFVAEFVQEVADFARHHHRQDGRGHHEDDQSHRDANDLAPDGSSKH
jgi:hypothetical protein